MPTQRARHPYNKMFGRPHGNARHLTDPANKIVFATMEEGFYEVDVKHARGAPNCGADRSRQGGGRPTLPGYHGKGFYSGQGRLCLRQQRRSRGRGAHASGRAVRACSPSGTARRTGPSCGATSSPKSPAPAAFVGNPRPDTDPLWSIGWDHRSLILMLLDARQVARATACPRPATPTTARTAGTPSGRASATSAKTTCS